VRSTLAEVPKVDHRIGQRFEGVVQLAEAFEPKQQAAKFIFPAKHPFYGIESLFENGRVEEWLAASYWLRVFLFLAREEQREGTGFEEMQC
jgi:hypothetical protein